VSLQPAEHRLWGWRTWQHQGIQAPSPLPMNAASFEAKAILEDLQSAWCNLMYRREQHTRAAIDSADQVPFDGDSRLEIGQ